MDDLKTSTAVKVTENLAKSASKYTRSIEQVEKQALVLNDSMDVFGKSLDIVGNRYKNLFSDSASDRTNVSKNSAPIVGEDTSTPLAQTTGLAKSFESIGKGFDIFKTAVKDINTAKSIVDGFKKGGFKEGTKALDKAEFGFLSSNEQPEKSIKETKPDTKADIKNTKSNEQSSFPSIGEIIGTVKKGMDVYSAGKSIVKGYKKGGVGGGLNAILKTDVGALFSSGSEKANPSSGKENRSGSVQKVYVVNMNQLDSGGRKSKRNRRQQARRGVRINRKATYNPSSTRSKSTGLSKMFGKVSKFGPLKYLSSVVQGANLLTNNEMSTKEKTIEATKLAGSTGGAALGMWGGAAAGAAIGSVVPIVGTAIGGIIGGLVGGYFGGEAGESLATGVTNAVTEPSKDNKQEKQTANIKISVEGEAKIKSVETENMNLDIAGSSMGSL